MEAGDGSERGEARDRRATPAAEPTPLDDGFAVDGTDAFVIDERVDGRAEDDSAGDAAAGSRARLAVLVGAAWPGS